MKTKETSNYLGCKTPDDESTREQAIAWWDTLDSAFKVKYCFEYNKSKQLPLNRKWSDLTGREIEEIWKNEVQVKELSNVHHNAEYLKPTQKQYSQEEVDRLLDQQAARTTVQVLRSNQKQFKQANPELISAYFDKFSKQDLENVILPLLQTKIKTI